MSNRGLGLLRSMFAYIGCIAYCVCVYDCVYSINYVCKVTTYM